MPTDRPNLSLLESQVAMIDSKNINQKLNLSPKIIANYDDLGIVYKMMGCIHLF